MKRWISVPSLGLIFVLAYFLQGGEGLAESTSVTGKSCYVSETQDDIRPGEGGPPTAVAVGIRMIDLTAINDIDQTLTGEFLIRQSWKDPRLAEFEGCKLPLTSVWSPDLAFANSGRVFLGLPQNVKIDAGGEVTYLQTYFGALASYHNLADFPFDEHIFKVWMLSPEFTEEQVLLTLDSQFTGRRELLNISDWLIGDVSGQINRFLLEATGNYNSRYELQIPAKRIKSFYIWKVILPLCLIVIMSWSVFWINPKKYGQQVGLSATSMLTLIAFLFATTNMVPKLGYFTTLDHFLGSALILVFLAFLQSLMVTYLVSKDEMRAAIRIDGISRVIFPIAFLLVIFVMLVF